MPIKIFFCYAHEDEILLNQLKRHLRALQRQALIEMWHDRNISAGTEWAKRIDEHLNTAQIILLLVSPDFMDSDYCYGNEMQQALARHNAGEARVIPIIFRHVYWQGEPLGKLQALPTDGKPIKSWQDQDEAFYTVAEGIREVVNELVLKNSAQSSHSQLREANTRASEKNVSSSSPQHPPQFMSQQGIPLSRTRKTSARSGRGIGIDLGITNSCIATLEYDEPTVLSNAEGSHTTPSIVAFTHNGERLFGDAAKRQAITNPANTIYSIQRFIGCKYNEPEVKLNAGLVSYNVVPASNGDAWIEVQGKLYSPPEILAMILQQLKTDAEAYLHERVTQAVITVPAYYNDAQRRAVKDAGKIAGLEVLRLINEPTAAALTYGLGEKNQRVAVYDLGGARFDISILELGEGVIEVKSTSGDTHLGGANFDQRIINWLADEFHKEQGIDLRQDRMALQRLTEAAVNAKKELSSSMQTEINLPYITADASGPKHLFITLSRLMLEQLVKDLIERSRDLVMTALSDAGIRSVDVDEVILAGGQTYMPAVQKMVGSIFNCKLNHDVNPDEVIAVGAALQAGVLNG